MSRLTNAGKQEMVDLQEAGKTKAFYRMQIERNMGTEELVGLMSAHRAGVSKGVTFRNNCVNVS